MTPPLPAVDAALATHFGQRPRRASVSFVGVDPIEVLRFEPVPGERAYLSLGMARHPMTAADAVMRTAEGPRGEVMLHVRDELDTFSDAWRAVAMLAAAPAVEGVVYRSGMTVDLGQPLAPGSACTGVLVEQSPVPDVSTDEGPVTVFLIVPATATELAWCRVHGSAALHDRWTQGRTDLLDLGRRAVDLG